MSAPVADAACTHANVGRTLIDAVLERQLADPAHATQMADEALRTARARPDGALEAQAWLARALARLRDGDDAAALAARAAAEQLPACFRDPRAIGLRRQLRAQLLRLADRNDEALSLLQALHEQADKRPPIDAFHTVVTLGIVHGMQDRMDDSLGCFYTALDLARRIGSLPPVVNALNNLGAQQLDLHNLDDALPTLRECLAGAMALGSRRLRIFAAGNLVQCLCALGQAGPALALAREHLIDVIRPDDPPSLQRDEEIAHALLDNGLNAEATHYLRREARPDVLTNPTTAVRAWLDARLLLGEGRDREALALCLAQQHLLDDDSVVPADRLRLSEFAAELAARCDEHRTAYALLRRAHQLQDELLGRAARARFVSLQIAHDLRGAHRERDLAQAAARSQAEANAALQAQIAANETLQARLRAFALEDALTGLGNRRHLMQFGPELMARSRREGQPVAVALCDLDHFKRVNDQHGHEAGDRVLQAFAGLARRVLRAHDLCCRLGGEEFAVLMPGATAEVAVRRLQALRVDFSGQRFENASGTAFRASFSAGVCEGRPDDGGLTLEALLRQADETLYRAKHAGRARVFGPASSADAASPDHIDADSIAR